MMVYLLLSSSLAIAEECPLQDVDGDGFTADIDCNDNDSSIHPTASEFCDDLDNNCDGTIDEGVLSLYYIDVDGDGFGNAAISIQACVAPNNFVEDDTDCDDTSNAIFPGSIELCDGIDNNCDGTVDQGVLSNDYFVDADGDGFGDPTNPADCVPQSTAVQNTLDCDDGSNSIFPGSIELCDGIDNNCDGNIDENASDSLRFYSDMDGDGFGDATNGIFACTAPIGFVSDSSDCDDGDPASFPLGSETCDGVDNDCNGVVDDPNVLSSSLYFIDADGDGFGNSSITIMSCSTPLGYVSDAGDCDDANASVYPTASETCDGVDNNCDGDIDEGIITSTVYFIDADGDGFGSSNATISSCTQPQGYVSNNQDCDDEDSLSTTSTSDADCDGIEGVQDCDDSDPNIGAQSNDADCDGIPSAHDCNDNDASVGFHVFRDYDGDGFGSGQRIYVCDMNIDENTDGIPDYTDEGGDCFDGLPYTSYLNSPKAAFTYPGAAFNEPDIDGDGIDDCTQDFDGDGYGDQYPRSGVPGSDCNDEDSTVNPSVDADGDGAHLCVDCNDTDPTQIGSMVYIDGDGDGFGKRRYHHWDTEKPHYMCTLTPGYSLTNDDCLDWDPFTYPGAAFNEPDMDGDGINDCAMDMDGDGYANGKEYLFSWGVDYIGSDCDDYEVDIHPGVDNDGDGADACRDCDDCDAQQIGFLAYSDDDYDGYGNTKWGEKVYVCSLTSGFSLNDDDCSPWTDTAFPGAAYHEPDIDGDGIDDCTQDNDGDGYGSETFSAYYTQGTDCDDNDPNTYSGAGFNESSPYDEACLTDSDGDGYGEIVEGYFEESVQVGDCFDITILSITGIGCYGSADLYIDGALTHQVVGPTAGSGSTEKWCSSASGLLQVGWSEPKQGWWNTGCGMEIKENNVTLYSYMGSPTNQLQQLKNRRPPGGTDIDDQNAMVH